jgi:hypothetical protein
MTAPVNRPVSCPHYLPSTLGAPQVLCRGCGSLVTDNRHPQNQALGLTGPQLLSHPGARNQPRRVERLA